MANGYGAQVFIDAMQKMHNGCVFAQLFDVLPIDVINNHTDRRLRYAILLGYLALYAIWPICNSFANISNILGGYFSKWMHITFANVREIAIICLLCILLVRSHFKVFWVDASLIVASMLNYHAFPNWANKQFVAYSVRALCSHRAILQAADAKFPVPAIAESANPIPASGFFVNLNARPKEVHDVLHKSLLRFVNNHVFLLPLVYHKVYGYTKMEVNCGL